MKGFVSDPTSADLEGTAIEHPNLFVSVLEGDTPDETRPIFVSRDPAIIRAVAEAVAQRLTERQPVIRLAGDDEEREEASPAPDGTVIAP